MFLSPLDTIHGRQCMASCFFLLKQFEDVLIYFNSIKSYFYNDDSFNFNYAQAKAANGNFKEAEEVGMLTSGPDSERFRNSSSQGRGGGVVCSQASRPPKKEQHFLIFAKSLHF